MSGNLIARNNSVNDQEMQITFHVGLYGSMRSPFSDCRAASLLADEVYKLNLYRDEVEFIPSSVDFSCTVLNTITERADVTRMQVYYC